MSISIDYYFTPQSPWTYLGHDRFVQIARAAGAAVRVLPVDFGKIFPASGGLPLGQRAPQRQAYRLVELQRFGEHLQIPLNRQPKYFPVGGDPAARLITTVDQQDGSAAALALCGAIFRAVWAEERDITSEQVLAEILHASGLDAGRLAQSHSPAVQQLYEAHTQQALDAGVFGAPSYVVEGEIFWGQDRLDLLEKKLAAE
ncbi:2-hydroxychromene-2-carboxylate isomerase [Polaromonas sp.]|uniref:2-hydroxychromene-2-carboxylate isomerase n=1 Tax=Polaromonas sp. TaxID=1869339 RepID=UPI003266B453